MILRLILVALTILSLESPVFAASITEPPVAANTTTSESLFVKWRRMTKDDIREVLVNKTKSIIRRIIEGDPEEGIKPCPYMCEEGEELVKRVNFTPTINGCGASGFEKVLNSNLPVKDLEECCNEHDVCYNDCAKTKEECEDEFRICLQKTCHVTEVKLHRCRFVAKGFHTFTNRFSCPYYKKAKEEGCECVPSRNRNSGETELDSMPAAGEFARTEGK